jgi:hypothetical protein
MVVTFIGKQLKNYDMNDDLKYTFSLINDWLKYAEAKNAGLIGFNLASIYGIMSTNIIENEKYKAIVGLVLVLLCLSSILCLYSILPVLNKWFRFYKKMSLEEFKIKGANSNLLFFGDLASLSSKQYIELFEQKHSVQLTLSEKDFANQITNNSEIALQKFEIFVRAGWLTFISFFLLVILMSILFFE